jgi:hypothetical protein
MQEILFRFPLARKWWRYADVGHPRSSHFAMVPIMHAGFRGLRRLPNNQHRWLFLAYIKNQVIDF